MVATDKVPDKYTFWVWILLCLMGLRLTLLAGKGLTRVHFSLDSQGSCSQPVIFLFLAIPLCLLSLNFQKHS